jgi:hypothetical protein
VGFLNIRLRFDLDPDADDEQLDTLLRLTERYCVVYQTLAHSPRLEVNRVRVSGLGRALVHARISRCFSTGLSPGERYSRRNDLCRHHESLNDRTRVWYHETLFPHGRV